MKVFIGAFGGTGSRLVSSIFEMMGYNVERKFSNKMYDWGAYPDEYKYTDFKNVPYFVNIFDKCFKNKDYSKLFDYIDRYTTSSDFIIKHGHFMFIFDELKSKYNDCKTVYVNRNPIDSALKLEYKPHLKYSEVVNNSSQSELEIKFDFYLSESKKAIEKADLVIDYENLCLNPHEEITKMKNFMNSNFEFEDYSFIKTPKTLGVGKDYYEKYNNLVGIKEKIYTNEELTLSELLDTNEHLEFLLQIRNDDSTRFQLENNNVFTLDQCKEWYSKLTDKWKLIKVGGVNVGYVRLNGTDIGIDIHPHHRKRGYARRAYELYLKENRNLTLWVFEDNHAKKLYEDLGFKPNGESKVIRARNYIRMVLDG